MKSLKWSFLGLMALVFILFTACEKDSLSGPEEVNPDVAGYFHLLQTQSPDDGPGDSDSTFLDPKCFSIIFPLEVSIPGGTVQSVASEEELNELIIQWFEQNPDAEDFPLFVFPINVKLESGEEETVANDDELCELLIECWGEEDWDEDSDEDWNEDWNEDSLSLCFTFKFPVTIVLPDDATETVETEEALMGFFIDWLETNPDTADLPTFEFPLTVILDGDTEETLEDEEGLEDLLDDCFGEYYDDCFTINFPVKVEFPDATVKEVADEDALEALLDDWYDNNPETEEDPTFVFPIDITLEDGTVETINSEEELDEIFEHCYGEECPEDGRIILSENKQQATTKAALKNRRGK